MSTDKPTDYNLDFKGILEDQENAIISRSELNFLRRKIAEMLTDAEKKYDEKRYPTSATIQYVNKFVSGWESIVSQKEFVKVFIPEYVQSLSVLPQEQQLKIVNVIFNLLNKLEEKNKITEDEDNKPQEKKQADGPRYQRNLYLEEIIAKFKAEVQAHRGIKKRI